MSTGLLILIAGVVLLLAGVVCAIVVPINLRKKRRSLNRVLQQEYDEQMGKGRQGYG